MLILGDLACPNSECADILKSDMKNSGIFENKVVLCNLEGMIRDDEPYQDEKLFNHSKVLEVFEESKTVFSLANNHTYDYPDFIEQTQRILKQNGFSNVGIQNGESVLPVEIKEGSKQYAVFAHCWKAYTKTNTNTVNDISIVDCSYDSFFRTVKEYVAEYPEKRVICYFHWNYDMETLPFPAHRELAHDLIDVGVYAVVGNHSHVPQGGELYKGRVITYGLGNFYIPSGYFFNQNLKYPEQSKKTMVLELPENSDNAVCHWFQTDHDAALKHLCTEAFSDGKIRLDYSPFEKMSSKEYLEYFKSNRKKRFLVPVFESYRGLKTYFLEYAAIGRILIIKKLLRR